MRSVFICLAFFCFLTTAALAQNQPTKSMAEVGSPAPGFIATAMTGTTYDLEKLKGKVVVLNFWSTKCVACAAETKDLNALVDAYRGKEVVFLGFAHNAQPNVEKFLQKHPFKYEIFPASLQQMIVPYGKPIGNGFYDIPFPMHIVINDKGVVEVNQTGMEGVGVVKRKLAELFKNNNSSTAK